MKMYEILSGDYYSSSNEHIMVPADVDLHYQHGLYRLWLKESYHPYRDTVQYLDFPGWLVKNTRCRETTENELGYYEEGE